MSKNQIRVILLFMLGCAPDYSVKGPAVAVSGGFMDSDTDTEDDNDGDLSDPDAGDEDAIAWDKNTGARGY